MLLVHFQYAVNLSWVLSINCSAELFKNKVHTGFARLIINYSKELTEAQLKLRLMFWLSYTVRYFNLWFATLFNKVKTQSLLQWHFKFWSITTISYLTMESYEMHHLAKTISLQLDLIVNRWGWTISNGQCLFKWTKVKRFALIFCLLNNETSLSRVDYFTSFSVHLIYTWFLFISLDWC